MKRQKSNKKQSIPGLSILINTLCRISGQDFSHNNKHMSEILTGSSSALILGPVLPSADYCIQDMASKILAVD